jgi:Concanavalin A-like lectin/glucanases superfamily
MRRFYRGLLLETLEARLCLSTVAYWRFEEGKPNVAANGINTILDSSGNDLDGTPFGGPVYRSSVGDNPIPASGDPNALSLDFNGANQRIFIPDDRLFRLTHSLTLEAYINVRAIRNAQQQIVFRGDNRPELDPYELYVDNNDVWFRIENQAAVHAPLPGLNQWFHVAGTLDDSTGRMALYENGKLVASTITTIRPLALLDPTRNPGLGIGNVESSTYSEYFNGLIDEVRISDVALSPDQFLDFPSPPTSFQIAAPASAVAGQPFAVIVTALDAKGHSATGYTGTVTFTSSDSYPGLLPANYAFTASDKGTHAFVVSLFTAGAQTLTVEDMANTSITGSSTVTVQAAPANHFLITAPSTADSGTPFDVTVTAVDAYNNVDTSYTGTITFTSSDSDPGVMLPGEYTFQSTDGGTHTFPDGVVLITPGDQTITATDTVNGQSGSIIVTVGSGPAAPPRGGRRPLSPAPALAVIDWLFASASAAQPGSSESAAY